MGYDATHIKLRNHVEQKSSLIQLQNQLDMSFKKIYDGKCFSCPLELQINNLLFIKGILKEITTILSSIQTLSMIKSEVYDI